MQVIGSCATIKKFVEGNMKSKRLACVTVITLFAALAMPVGRLLTAQEQPTTQQHEEQQARYILTSFASTQTASSLTHSDGRMVS
jgi:hypothetical protein